MAVLQNKSSVILCFILIGCAASINFIDYPDKMVTCNTGDIVQNECTKCICNHNIYECSFKNCTQHEKGYTKIAAQNPNSTYCYPNSIYHQNNKTCICNGNGQWPHQSCYNIFQSLSGEIEKTKCEPNKYVIIQCNVCRCTSNGEIDSEHCTKNICETDDKELNPRRSNTPKDVYGTCKAGTWYSMAPCQFCYCVKSSKLLCNNPVNTGKNLHLGKYNFTVCGKDMMTEAKSLADREEKSLRDGSVKNLIKAVKTNDISAEDTIISATFNSGGDADIDFNAKIKVSAESSDIDNPNLSIENANYKEDSVSKNENFSIGNANESEHDKVDKASEEVTTVSPKFKKGKKKSISRKGKKEASKTADMSIYDLLSPAVKGIRSKIKIDVPQALYTIASYILRKSMVTIDENSSCTPGTQSTVDCNTCFCLNNEKLLCTNNPCT